MLYQVLSKTVAEGFKTMRKLKLTSTDTVGTEKFFQIFFNTCSLKGEI